MTILSSNLRTGPPPPPAPVFLRVRAWTCWPTDRVGYATLATACCQERRDTFLASATALNSDGDRRRAAKVRSHFPAGTRPRSLRWRRSEEHTSELQSLR